MWLIFLLVLLFLGLPVLSRLHHFSASLVLDLASAARRSVWPLQVARELRLGVCAACL